MGGGSCLVNLQPWPDSIASYSSYLQIHFMLSDLICIDLRWLIRGSCHRKMNIWHLQSHITKRKSIRGRKLHKNNNTYQVPMWPRAALSKVHLQQHTHNQHIFHPVFALLDKRKTRTQRLIICLNIREHNIHIYSQQKQVHLPGNLN